VARSLVVRIRRPEADYFEPEVVEAIYAAVPDEYAAFTAVQGVLGLRFGEAAPLRRSSVDLMHRRLRVSESLAEISGDLVFGPPKTHAVRKVPITAEPLVELLPITWTPTPVRRPTRSCSRLHAGSRSATRGSGRRSGCRRSKPSVSR
jgi:integrase